METENGFSRYFNGRIKTMRQHHQDYMFITDGAGYINVNYSIKTGAEDDYEHFITVISQLAKKHFQPLTKGKHLTIPNASVVKDTLYNTRLQHFFLWKKGRLPNDEEFQVFKDAISSFKEELETYKEEYYQK